jgi:PIN domain nuclease of toxin-antitoxin system
MSFAGTAARGSAIPSPVEGMAAYLEDSNLVSLYDGSAWKTSLSTTGGILQVVSAVKTDTFSMSSTTFADITGLQVTITPKSTNSKMLILADVKTVADADLVSAVLIKLVRDSTDIFIGDAAGSRPRATFAGAVTASGTIMTQASGIFLDSPATTSAITYKVRIASTQSQLVFVNRTRADTDNAVNARGASSITVMEVAN